MIFLSLRSDLQPHQLSHWSVLLHKTVEEEPACLPKTPIYLQADTNYSWIYYADGSRKLTARTLKYHQAKLPSAQFVRLNRMVLVNRQFIERVERYSTGCKVYLSIGIGFFVSRRRWPVVRAQLTHLKRATPWQATILVIEDNEDQQVILHYMLHQQFPNASSVQTATSTQALAYLTNCQEEDQAPPKLILLDLYLPKREDGWDLLRQLRLRAELQQTPIVVMSYSDDPKDPEESHYWGASAYLTKPILGQAWQGHFESLDRYWC